MLFAGHLISISSINYEGDRGVSNLVSCQLQSESGIRRFKLGKFQPLQMFRLFHADKLVVHANSGI